MVWQPCLCSPGSWWLILWVLRRLWQSYARDVPYNGTRFIFAAVLGLLFGLILWNCAHKQYDPVTFSGSKGSMPDDSMLGKPEHPWEIPILANKQQAKVKTLPPEDRCDCQSKTTLPYVDSRAGSCESQPLCAQCC